MKDNPMINLSDSLDALRNRRKPMTAILALEKSGKYDPTFESIIDTTSKKGIRYILGAMQPIPESSTKFLLEQGKSFSNTIIKNLNLPVTFRFQGSVPLNVHIKSASDLDILFIHSNNLHVPRKINEFQYQEIPDTILDTILDIKTKCKNYFDARQIDYKYNDKSIKILDLFPVNTDLVPSCWHHTVEYQIYKTDYEIGITILDEKDNTLIQNYPFKHIHLVRTKNESYNDKLGKCIRLLKNIKADLPEGNAITLSGFDITSFIYHMPYFENITTDNELNLANHMLNYLRTALNNKGKFSALRTPDNSRNIFDSPHKFFSLEIFNENLNKILEMTN